MYQPVIFHQAPLERMMPTIVPAAIRILRTMKTASFRVPSTPYANRGRLFYAPLCGPH